MREVPELIQMQTILRAADNTGARNDVHKRCSALKRKYANIGDVIVCSVKNATPGGVVKKG